MPFVFSLSLAAIALPSVCWAQADPATGDLQVSASVYDHCIVSSVETLAFGSLGIVLSAQPATAAFAVKCTDTTTYSIGIDDGNGDGATTAARKMTAGGTSSDTLTYSLYQDSSHGTIWGDDEGERMTDREGTGAAQLYTVYGLIPVQDMPSPGSYSDTATITVRF